MSNAIVQQVTSNGALSAEHYQSFEIAKANDGIIGGDDISQIRSYAAFARAQAQAVHKSIASMKELDDVTATKAEMTETAQTFAKVGVYADQRIGEILRDLPTKQGKRTDVTSVCMETEVTKGEAIKNAGIAHQQAIDLQKMAANPEVVEAVIAKAEQDGKVVSRSQVLKAIKERDAAERERDNARRELQKASITQTNLEMEAESLRQKLAQKPKPEVIERTIEVESEASKRRIAELERLERLHNEDYQKLRKRNEEMRKQLDQANELLGEKERTHNASRDIEQLTIATNSYLRNYGGKAWAFDQFDRADATTQQEFTKAITSLAAFAQNLAQMIQQKNQLGV